MKLFKSLLVAPATLGLLAPMSATANEVTISDFTPAEQLAITNSRVDGLEARLNNIEAGSFSETTTASFSVDFGIGAVDGKDRSTTGDGHTDGDEELQATYGFQIDLNTSFTGEDSLDISIDAGNASGSLGEFDLNGPVTTGGDTATDDVLVVDGISYTFPVSDKATLLVGNNTDGSALFTIACAYGTPSNTMDDCGAPKAGITGGATTFGASYDFGAGFTAAAGFQTEDASIGTKESQDKYALNFAYTADNYGASLTYAAEEHASGSDHTDYYTALNAYYTFDNGISISGGYETGVIANVNQYEDETTAYFVGVESEFGPGTVGAAFGTQGAIASENSSGTSITEEDMMYELYYSYEVNDGMTVTPLIYTKEGTTATDVDETGIMVKTSFSF